MIPGIPEIGLIGNVLHFARGASRGISPVDMLVNRYNPYKDALSRADPLMTYSWYVELPGYDFHIGDALGGDLLGQAASTAMGGLSGLPYYYIEEASFPMRNYHTRQVFRNGNYKKYPDKYDVSDMSLTVYADADGVALRYLNAWHNSPLVQFDSTTERTRGGIWRAPAGKVKRDIIGVILAPNYKKVAYLQYTGCWITTISEIAQDAAPATRVTYRINISVDDVFVTVSTAAALADVAGTIANVPL